MENDTYLFNLNKEGLKKIINKEIHGSIILFLLGFGLCTFTLLMWMQQLIIVTVIGLILLGVSIFMFTQVINRNRNNPQYKIEINNRFISLKRSDKSLIIINKDDIGEVHEVKGALLIYTENRKKGITIYKELKEYEFIKSYFEEAGFEIRKISKLTEHVLIWIFARVVLIGTLSLAALFPKIAAPILLGISPIAIFLLASDIYKRVKRSKCEKFISN